MSTDHPREAPRRPTPEERIADARLRLQKVQDDMPRRGFDALLLSSEANFAYATGYATPSWAISARPLAVLVEPTRCTAIVGAAEAAPLAAIAAGIEIATYTDPIPRTLDGLPFLDFATALIDVVRSLLSNRTRTLGIEATLPSASGLPYETLRALEEDGFALTDAASLLWPLRQAKTAYELERLEYVGAALGRLYELFASRAKVGMSERELHGLLVGAAGEVGVDRLGYLTVIAGADKPADGPPGDRPGEEGDLVFIDVGLVADGYWADCSRHFALGEPSEEYVAAYRQIVSACLAGRGSCRPGAAAADVARAIAAELPQPDGPGLRSIGRVGHGVGLDLTEPPSIAIGDETTLRPNMTLAVEPLGSFPFGHLIAEENVAVTDSEARLLSVPFPSELPRIGG
jgi:Xaa-Pro dipeptidase